MNLKVDINVCRVCLKSDTGTTMFSEKNVIEKFQYTTQLKIQLDDGMPNLLCDRCVSRLKISYEFRRQSIISDRHLRAFIRKVNTEFKEVASSTSATSKDLMTVNDDEMELLLEAGYKPEDVGSVSTLVPVSVSKVEKKIEVKSENIDFIADMENYIQEDDGGENQPFVVDLQLEESVEEADDGEDEDFHGDDSNEMVEDVENDDDMTPEEYIDGKSIDPFEKLGNETRSHYCIKCSKDFSTKTNLMRHMLTHDGVKPFQCTICGNGFTQNGSLKQHMLIHTGERPFKCEVCGRGFTQSKSLIFHMRRHTGEKPFTCEKCGLTFRQKDGLKRHIHMKHSGSAAEVHICSICQRILHSRYSLALHMKKHTGTDSEIKCLVCEKSFSSKASLETHNRQHTGEKPFKCTTCGKEFSRKGSLQTHEKLHLDERPFKCEDCNKSFVQKHQLFSHIQTHKNKSAKTFQCGKCYKTFAIKRNLLQHLRNHNRDTINMFKCDDCSIAFNTKRDLKLHRINQHKETVSDLNECDICHIPFVSIADLNNHTAAVHDAIDEKCQQCDQHFLSKKLFDDHLLEHELMTLN